MRCDREIDGSRKRHAGMAPASASKIICNLPSCSQAVDRECGRFSRVDNNHPAYYISGSFLPTFFYIHHRRLPYISYVCILFLSDRKHAVLHFSWLFPRAPAVGYIHFDVAVLHIFVVVLRFYAAGLGLYAVLAHGQTQHYSVLRATMAIIKKIEA